jgi:dTDP-glucose 4,6-dehydratase
MKVLVTGSLGTLGRPLHRELLDRGHDAHGCDLRHSPQRGFIRADVASYRELADVFERIEPDACYHLAAEFGRLNGELYYEALWRTNVIGTRNVMELCRRHGTNMILASSSEVYGEEAPTELLDEGLTEREIPFHPNEYALSKWVNERQVLAYERRYPDDFAAMRLRFFNAYGPGETFHPYRSVIALFCGHALRGEPFTLYQNYHRTFMYISDFIPTLANACERFAPGEVMNIGGVDYRSMEEVAEIVLEHTGADRSLVQLVPQEEHNVRSKRPNIDRARRLLDHDPGVTLEEGIPPTVEWLRRDLETYG